MRCIFQRQPPAPWGAGTLAGAGAGSRSGWGLPGKQLGPLSARGHGAARFALLFPYNFVVRVVWVAINCLAWCEREEESPRDTGMAEPEWWRRGVSWESGEGWRGGGIWLNNSLIAARCCTSARPGGVWIHSSFCWWDPAPSLMTTTLRSV